MKKWVFALAAAAFIVIGCAGGGGGGGNSSGGGNGGNNGGNLGSAVNLPSSTGLVNFTILSGAGRAAGDSSAVITRVQLKDSQTLQNGLEPEHVIQLNGYTNQTIRLNVPTTNSRFFSLYYLTIDELRVQNDQGGFDHYGNPNDANEPLVFDNFPAMIRAFPGRQTNVTVRLDDTMLFLDNGTPTFDRDVFAAVNENPDTGTINGFLSDYIMFDISAMDPSAQPDLPAGGKATRVYFSGDNLAISDSADLGTYNVLTPLGFVEGTDVGPTQLTDFGTYSLVQPDPRDPDPNTLARITALQGIWRFYDNVIQNQSDFEVITMPSSADDTNQTVLIIKKSNGVISNMYFGQADLAAGTLKAYPIGQISPGSADNEISGTLTNTLDRNGNPTSDPIFIRSGSYTLAAGTDPSNSGTLPGDFNTSGRFIVYRR